MANNHIDGNTEIDNSGITLNDIKENKSFELDNATFIQIGTYHKDNKPIYKMYIDLGALPNTGTIDYKYSMPKLYGVLNITCMAFDPYTNDRIPVPYVYPNVQYVDYWVTLELITNEFVRIISNTNRSRFHLWLVAEYIAEEKLI